jgi:iron(III) transport system substrate-binding protein
MTRSAPALLVVVGSLLLLACGGPPIVAPPAPTTAVAPTSAPAAVPMSAAAPTAPAASASSAPDVAKRKADAQAKGMLYVTRDEIMAGAEKEGEIIVSPGFEETIDPVKQAFTSAYPMIKKFTWRVVTGNAAGERNAAEIIAGRSDLDVFDINPTYRADLEKANVFAKYDLKAMIEDGQLKIPARSIDAGGWSTWSNNSMLVIVYNTDLVSEADAPKSWDSCLDPKWSGKFFVDTDVSAFSALYTVWGEQKVLDYTKKLKDNNPIFIRGGTAGLTRLASGEASFFCGTNYHSTIRLQLKDTKAPVKVVIADPLPVIGKENEGISVKAQHPNAALLWLEWLASPSGTQILDTIDPGVASRFFEGTRAFQVTREFDAQGGQTAFCDADCSQYKEKFAARIAGESWGFPVGFDPGQP